MPRGNVPEPFKLFCEFAMREGEFEITENTLFSSSICANLFISKIYCETLLQF